MNTAKELTLHNVSDKLLLDEAKTTGKLLITRDKDFGMLVFLKEELSSGVIFLRITPSTINEVHNELLKVLNKYDDNYLKRAFCVIEPHRHRIRHL